MIYIVILIIFIVACLTFDFGGVNKSTGTKDLWYWLLFALLVFTAGFRYKVGGDTMIYEKRFFEIPFLSDLSNYDFAASTLDPFWVIFSSFFRTIKDDFFFFQFFHVLIINGVIFWFIRKYTLYRFTALLIYFLFSYIYFSMEIMRESLSICIFLIAYPYLERKRYLKYYLLCVVSFLFHSSAIILFILPIFQLIRLSRFNLVVMLAFFIIVFSISLYVPSLMNYILFTDRLLNKFETYSNVTANINGTILYFIFYWIFPYMVITQNRKISSSEHRFSNLYMAYFVLVAMFLTVNGFLRFLNYLTPFMLIYFADFLITIYKSYRFQLIRAPVVILTIAIALIPKITYYTEDMSRFVVGTHRYNLWYPYSSVFLKEEYYFREIIFLGRMQESYDNNN